MIPYGKHAIDELDIQAVVDVLKSVNLTQGPKILEFEKAVADYTEAKYAVAVSHGTAAQHLTMLAADIGTGSSIITSPITFVSTANSGKYVGADVHFSDIDSTSINLSPETLKKTVSKFKNVRAIVPVHFAGFPCEMSEIKAIADDVGAVVIEDAAHALGAVYPNGKKVGCCEFSLMTIFSFHPVKAIAAGEGGMITTNDDGVYQRLLRLRSHGINKGKDSLFYPNQHDENGIEARWYYELQELGYNYRITDIQAALGLSQFRKIDAFIEKRRSLVKKYDKSFSNLPHCQPIQLNGRDVSAHHIYVLRIDFATLKISRQFFMNKLFEKGIGTQVHYIPVPLQPYYKSLGGDLDHYSNAKNYYNEAISIPLYYSLSDAEQQFVIDSICELLA
tara:strand:+ start:619 stop:1791 length:1173 start_codon:yes stop_codon:yes gene_type:complete